ncbi:MAG: sulfotransferase [Chitinophagaceae bacterium]|nr:sulfotransferase [Chitinophagaceae bacterium]
MHQRTVTATSFNSRPAWFNLINSVWGSTYLIGTEIKLTKDHLIKLARKQTALQSFGADFWEEPLERLLDSVNREAQLTPIGRFITQKRLVNMLVIRLRAEQAFKKYPEILEQQLYPVQLICGLQRTGTTKLQRLLAADPDNRVLLSWEAINPVPFNDKPNEKEDRIKVARLSEKALRLMAPGFFSIHPVEYEKPEEDILLLDNTFLSTTPEATMHVPSYAAWLEGTDQTIAYEYMIKLLKYLQFQQPAKRWVLKSPHHLEFLPVINKLFDKVQFIWTHRDISESLPSFLSMVAHSQSIFSNGVTAERVAKHWVRKTAFMLSNGIAFRKANNDLNFVDVFYQKLVDAPMEALSDIYKERGPVSTELAQRFMETEVKNTKNKYGAHAYRLGDFGLTRQEIDEKWGSIWNF